MRPSPTDVLTAAVCGLLASCDSDHDHGGVTRLNFATANIHECEGFTLDVDLDASAAELARQDDGLVDCMLDPSLDTLGCDVEFEELYGGGTLHVSISGCEISSASNLFECGFTHANTSEQTAVRPRRLSM